MSLLAIGLNHATAPVTVRERFAFPADVVRDALADLRAHLPAVVQESAILATCNRTELYCAVREPLAAHGELMTWLGRTGVVPPGDLRRYVYALPHDAAVRHVFRVASGLESMVLGEPQILGQMKEAARHAQEAGALGTVLHRLFQRSFSVAKEVRTRTGIGSGSVSLAAAAVRVAQRTFADLSDTRVLLIGAGEMIELAAAHFGAQHPRAMVVANRTLERAERLCRRYGAEPLRLAELPAQLEHFDVVVSCTASSRPILGLGMVQKASRARGATPLLLLDLAVPRDIEAEAGRVPNVLLYTIDDLGQVVREGVTLRHAAAAHAEAIVQKGVDSFMRWMTTRGAAPLLRTLDEHVVMLRAVELERARRRLARGDDVDSALEALAMGLSNKLLHAPRSLLARGALRGSEAERLVEGYGTSARHPTFH